MSRSLRTILAALAALALALALAACGEEEGGGGGGQQTGGGGAAQGKAIQRDPANARTSVTVGSKNFPEQFVLGEIYSQALQAAGFTVKKQLNLGSEQIAYKSLKQGEIDAYPEYTGTALTSFFKVKVDDVPRDPDQAYEQAKTELAKNNVTALPRTPFENTYRLGMEKQNHQRIGAPKTTSELEGKAQDLVITGYPECRQRTDCLLGVERQYGLDFKKFLASQQTYEVIEGGQADVGFVFTTDAQLTTGKFVTLEDDKNIFPPYHITFMIRNDTLQKIGPKGREVLERVQRPLTEEQMR